MITKEIAVRVAGREPFAESYHWDSLQPDFDELTAEAGARTCTKFPSRASIVPPSCFARAATVRAWPGFAFDARAKHYGSLAERRQ